jgi:hypothetical protein
MSSITIENFNGPTTVEDFAKAEEIPEADKIRVWFTDPDEEPDTTNWVDYQYAIITEVQA